MDVVEGVGTDEIVGRVAEELLGRVVHVGKRAVGSEEGDLVLGVIKEDTQ